MTVAETDALLYLPGRDRNGLERALRIPALSAGWRSSFETLLQHEGGGDGTTGNPALAPAAQPSPAWAGFRPLRVADKRRGSMNVTSLVLEPSDGHPLVAAMPGQFIVLSLKPRQRRRRCCAAILCPANRAGSAGGLASSASRTARLGPISRTGSMSATSSTPARHAAPSRSRRATALSCC